MSEIINSSGEVLEVLDSNDYLFIKNVVSDITQGSYIKLPTEEFLIIDYKSLESIETTNISTFIGYNNEEEFIEIDFDYEV